jgi:hypothetical protein
VQFCAKLVTAMAKNLSSEGVEELEPSTDVDGGAGAFAAAGRNAPQVLLVIGLFRWA